MLARRLADEEEEITELPPIAGPDSWMSGSPVVPTLLLPVRPLAVDRESDTLRPLAEDPAEALRGPGACSVLSSPSTMLRGTTAMGGGAGPPKAPTCPASTSPVGVEATDDGVPVSTRPGRSDTEDRVLRRGLRGGGRGPGDALGSSGTGFTGRVGLRLAAASPVPVPVCTAPASSSTVTAGREGLPLMPRDGGAPPMDARRAGMGRGRLPLGPLLPRPPPVRDRSSASSTTGSAGMDILRREAGAGAPDVDWD